jgi:dipeptidyl aminopeptidase/acylaminoacyl peptidase
LFQATYMASGRDVIVAKIDLHGSQGSGHLLRNSIYRQPGVLEAVDLIQTTKYVSLFHSSMKITQHMRIDFDRIE